MSELAQDKTFHQLIEHVQQTALLTSTDAALNWDERTMLPEAAGAYRAEQITFLSGLIHQRRTDPRIGEWLEHLATKINSANPHDVHVSTIRELKRGYDKVKKLPQRLVEELTRCSVLGQQAWVKARKADDFQMFRPLLDQMIALKKEQAEALGYTEHIYDPLLDDYEPHEKTVSVAKVLEALRKDLVPLVQQIAESKRRPDAAIISRHYPVSAQKKIGQLAAEKIGFDFARGRLDITDHPFCTTLGPNDCRITTRYDKNHFNGAFFGTLHEAGHGMYEQGLPIDYFGLPPGSYCSLGIHESQSRMWENMVGRSHAFWRHFYPQAQAEFPEALRGVTLDQFHAAINDVQPSLIRVEADEVTYNLHIIIRFELEQALMTGELSVADVPGAWREAYQNCLGIEPPDDADGVLQDVHWSNGLFGYFPTYSLGNLYAAQFYAQAEDELGDLNQQFAKGDFSQLLGWLKTNIHRHGQCYTAAELVEQATGEPLSHKPLIKYLREKLAPIYDL
jgi:carboxypeptidase Taq